MTDREKYDRASVTAKRKLAAELLEYKITQPPEFKELSDLADNEVKFYPVDEVFYTKRKTFGNSPFQEWFPDKSLDQCRLLEEKVDLSKYNAILADVFDENLADFFAPFAKTQMMPANEKLFCLFRSFGVIEKLEERK